MLEAPRELELRALLPLKPEDPPLSALLDLDGLLDGMFRVPIVAPPPLPPARFEADG